MPKGRGRKARSAATGRPRQVAVGGGSFVGPSAVGVEEAEEQEVEERAGHWSAIAGMEKASGGYVLEEAGEEVLGLKHYSPYELNTADYRQKGQVVDLAGGETLVAGQRIEAPGMAGKEKDYAVVGYYRSRGLDSVAATEFDEDNGVVYVRDADGAVAGVDLNTNKVYDSAGSADITPLAMGAVMVADRVRAERRRSDVEEQYADCYDEYLRKKRSGESYASELVMAADAHYAYTNWDSDDEKDARGVTFGAGKVMKAAGEEAGEEEEAASQRPTAHDELLAMGARPWSAPDGAPTSEDLASIPRPSSDYVLTGAHRQMLEGIVFDTEDGFRAFSIGGDPGTGKNYALEQLSAAEGRPHYEVTTQEDMEVSQLFGATVMSERGTHFEKGELWDRLERGHRIVINEPNTLPPETLTMLYDVAGSRGTKEERWVTLSDPQSPRGESSLRIHPDTEVYFTYNPEGTSSRKMPAALMERCKPYILDPPTPAERAPVMGAFVSRLSEGKRQLPEADAGRLSSFFAQVRELAINDEPGFDDIPHSRWANQLAATYEGRRQRNRPPRPAVLDHCQVLLDNTFRGATDRSEARQKISDIYDRCFGSGG